MRSGDILAWDLSRRIRTIEKGEMEESSVDVMHRIEFIRPALF